MLVWGFTAALVSMLLSLGGWETPWDTGHIEDLPPEALAASVDAQADSSTHDGAAHDGAAHDGGNHAGQGP